MTTLSYTSHNNEPLEYIKDKGNIEECYAHIQFHVLLFFVYETYLVMMHIIFDAYYFLDDILIVNICYGNYLACYVLRYML